MTKWDDEDPTRGPEWARTHLLSHQELRALSREVIRRAMEPANEQLVPLAELLNARDSWLWQVAEREYADFYDCDDE